MGRRAIRAGLALSMAVFGAACASSGATTERARARLASDTTTSVTPPGPAAAGAADPAGRWTLFAVGDVKLDRTEERDVDPFLHVQPGLSTANVTLANAEMAIATSGTPAEKEYTFRARPSAAATLARAGVDAVSLANKHALDYGPGALLETVSQLRAAGVGAVGAGENADAAYAPWSVEVVPGVRLAVLAASTVLPASSWVAGSRPGIASAYDARRLTAAVVAAAASHGVVAVFMHWGIERDPCPDAGQQRLATALLDAGATVVLGAHPHVLQPIVATDGKLVAFSLGNFAFDTRVGPAGETGVLELQFEGVALSKHVMHPHSLESGVPRPADAEHAARVADSLTRPCPPA